MSKTLASTSMELTLQVINWDQYFNAIIRERSYRIVEEYVVQNKTCEPASFEKAEESQDSVYSRDYIILEELENPSEIIRKQLMNQLNKAKMDFVDYGMNFQDSVEEAVFKAMEKFVDIESCVVVYMNEHHGYKHYMLAPTSRDELVIRLASYSQGAVIVYTPTKFTLFKVKT